MAQGRGDPRVITRCRTSWRDGGTNFGYIERMQTDRPDAAALAHLNAEIRYVRALLEAHIRRLQRAGRLPPPDFPFPGTTVFAPEIESRLSESKTMDALLGELDAESVLALDRARTLGDQLAKAAPDLPLARLRTAFGLTDEEYLVLLVSVAAEFDPGMARLFAYAHDHFERQYPTLALLADCVVTPTGGVAMRWILDPEASLRTCALIQLDNKRKTLPELHRPILSDQRIVRFVQGFAGLDEQLSTVATLDHADRAPTDAILTGQDQGVWDRVMAQADEHLDRPWDLPIIAFRGAEGIGKHHWSRALARRLNQNHLRVDLAGLTAEYGSLERGLRVSLREARLQNAVLCFDSWASVTEAPRVMSDEVGLAPHDERRFNDVCRVFGRVLRGYPGAVMFAIDSLQADPPRLSRPVQVVDLSMPDLPASIELWKRFLPKRMRAPGVTYKKLAQSFRMTPGQLIDAVQEATGEATPRPDGGVQLDYAAIGRAVKRQLRHRLGDNAALIQLDYAWDDLVIPPDVELQMRELIGRYEQRAKVFETWGLGKRFGTGQGLSVLFEGPPGTGKTMAASIVARELDLDLFQIDLSKIVSRYIGETEKNLGKVFDEAERARAMLLFDEADSLFSSRTAVKSSNDRYANLEVNYLLQRVEHFTGIAVLTTNFPTGLDEAFRRRIAMRISFPKPEVAERERLWGSMLTNQQILAPDLDLEDLAYEFELAGGHIKNAVLRAAFIAANRGWRIDQELLRIAARIELKEQGLLVHGSPYDELREHKQES